MFFFTAMLDASLGLISKHIHHRGGIKAKDFVLLIPFQHACSLIWLSCWCFPVKICKVWSEKELPFIQPFSFISLTYLKEVLLKIHNQISFHRKLCRGRGTKPCGLCTHSPSLLLIKALSPGVISIPKQGMPRRPWHGWECVEQVDVSLCMSLKHFKDLLFPRIRKKKAGSGKAGLGKFSIFRH